MVVQKNQKDSKLGARENRKNDRKLALQKK